MTSDANRLALLKQCCAAITGNKAQSGRLRWHHTYPRWLRWRLPQMAKMVKSYRVADDLIPSPGPIRDDLENFMRSCRTIKRGLEDRAVVAFLAHDGEAAGHRAEIVSEIIADLMQQADQARHKVPTGQGIRKALPYPETDTLTGHQLCAWVVREAIEHATGRRPGIRNGAAIDAANALFQMAGGDRLEGEGWRLHFEAVRRMEETDCRQRAWFATWEHTFPAEPGPVC